MTVKDKIELRNKIMRGLEESHKKLIASKKRNNEELIILEENQIVKVKL